MEPLFTTLDVLDTFDRFGRVARYAEPIRLGETVAATFCDAGHILGSASILVEVGKADRRRRIVFSGDLGSAGRALLPDPKPPSRVDVAVMETTYGDRKHRSFQASVDELHQAIAEALDRGGNVVIPTFALERAQEILFYFREGIEAGKLPRSLTVFLDSPMAISATEIFRRHPDFYRDDLRAMFARGKDPFDLPNLYFVREAADSIALNRIRSGAVILAGSGMCTGGRVRHHLRHNLSHADNSVIFVGFAAEGTLARIIIDGAKTVRLFGDEVPVRAKIHTINGFSAHGDQQDLRDWYDRLGDPQQTFLVHGEPDAMAAFARQLKSTQVHMPRLHEAFDL